MLACVYDVYLIVGNKLSSSSFNTEIYILGYIYIWKYLVYYFLIYLAILDIQLRAQIYLSVHIIVGMG